jgi:hypothetical protein
VQHLQRPQVGPDLAGLSGRGEKLIAYSVVSLWLW